MEPKEAQFYYEPLPTPDSFRFALLKRGVGQDPIECVLFTRTVKQEEDSATFRWEALSWVWGAYGDFRTIIVNGRTFQVTRNLFIALSHLRQERSDRLLWIDGICINQTDIAERSSQISQMAFLFHRASKVIAWLGEGNASSQIVMRLARNLHDFESGNLISCDENIMYILALTFGVPNVKANLSNSLFHYWNIHKFENWNHVDHMVDRNLFRRSWVLQEGALAKDLVVTCGMDSISWDAFFRAVSLRYSHDGRARDSQTINKGWSAIQAIENLRQLVATKKHLPDLLELLWACRNYQSTDPRDRIFALLGVSNLLYGHGPHHQLGFEIDYSKPVVDTFKDFTVSMIAKYQDLRVLATRRPNRTFDDKHLGSWCPD
jgi:Heterokaryon incompatibility protein (HET)